MQTDGKRSEGDSKSWLRFLDKETALDLATKLVWLARGKVDVVRGGIRDVVGKRCGTYDGKNSSLNWSSYVIVGGGGVGGV